MPFYFYLFFNNKQTGTRASEQAHRNIGTQSVAPQLERPQVSTFIRSEHPPWFITIYAKGNVVDQVISILPLDLSHLAHLLLHHFLVKFLKNVNHTFFKGRIIVLLPLHHTTSVHHCFNRFEPNLVFLQQLHNCLVVSRGKRRHFAGK